VIDTCYLNRNTGVPTAQGGQPFRLELRLDSTFNLAVAFLDDTGTVIPLPSGTTGRFVLKPLERFQSGPRFLMQSWTVSGEGALRRYHFSAILDSAALRADFGNLATKAYAAQIEYTVNGEKFLSQDIPCNVANSYFQLGDAPPELPIGGPESIEFHAEIFPPGAPISSGTHYAGNINRGGDLFNVRLSVQEYHPGYTVQIRINGTTNLFTAPVAITGQTNVWTQADEVNQLAVATLPDGARIDVITVFLGGGEYPIACDALELDIALRTRSTIDQEGWEWLKERIVGGTVDDEEQTITLPPNVCRYEIDEAEEMVIISNLSGTPIFKLPYIPVTP